MSMSFKNTINEVINLGVSEAELAEVFSVSLGTIQRYRTGAVIPTVNTQYILITSLAKYLARNVVKQ